MALRCVKKQVYLFLNLFVLRNLNTFVVLQAYFFACEHYVQQDYLLYIGRIINQKDKNNEV